MKVTGEHSVAVYFLGTSESLTVNVQVFMYS